MLALLEEKHNAILAQYEQHSEALFEIQNTLYKSVLPSLVRDLHLEDDIGEWLKTWIADQGSIFRIFKKHKFDFKKTIEISTYTLQWRAKENEILRSKSGQYPVRRCIRNLPIKTRDIFGRPAILVKPLAIKNNIPGVKRELIHVYEKARQQMAFRHHFQESGCVQFVMIIDSKDVSFNSSILDVITWFVREVAPKFPGMCAAAFVINYSSKPYGLHNLIKRLLPANARARIYFPDMSELTSCFSRPLLLDSEENVDETIDVVKENAGQQPVAEEEHLKIISASSDSSTLSGNLSQRLPSMSVFNPYFGYPVISIPGSSAPLLRNGRRRKRDLARTLIRLWLVKLKRLADKTWLWILMTIVFWSVGLLKYRQLKIVSY